MWVDGSIPDHVLGGGRFNGRVLGEDVAQPKEHTR